MSQFIKSNNMHTYEFNSPERKLFIAVLSQAVHDAFSSHVPKVEKQQAQAWLISNSKDFKSICENAGRNAKYVTEKIRRKILKANGWNIDISVRTTPPRIRKQKHLTGNAYYAAKREQRTIA
jgi:Tfp pilus assembly protein PilE